MHTAKWEQNVLQRLQSDQAMTLDWVFGLSKEQPSDVMCEHRKTSDHKHSQNEDRI